MTLRLEIAFLVAGGAIAGAQRPSPAAANLHDSLGVWIDSMVRGYRGTVGNASIAVAVVRGQQTVLLDARGPADQDAHRAAGPQTTYAIGSLTKQITASAIMRLVERGKLDLDSNITRYLPEFPARGRTVTIRQLLTHTSGIHNYTNDAEWKRHWAEEVSPATELAWVKDSLFDFPPGTRNAYSNTGYTVLGMIIERVTGTSYANYVERELFAPLGLRQTRYCASHPTDTLAAKGYATRNQRLAPADFLNMSIPYAAGAICSSVSDFIAWERAFHSGHVVGADSYRKMMTPGTLADGRRFPYGFGMTVGTLNGHAAAMHGGEVNGFTSAQIYLPADSVGVVVFTNDQSATPQILALDLARIVVGIKPNGFGALDRR